MSLSAAEMSSKGKEVMEYLEAQPSYVQSLVTDCIVDAPNIFMAADVFDEEVEAWLELHHPEKLDEYRKEYM
jgi:plasmid maintenance system antidote protein VapI